MYCKYCEKETEKDSLICVHCEKHLAGPEVDEGETEVSGINENSIYNEDDFLLSCGNCGEEIKAGDPFCGECGKRILRNKVIPISGEKCPSCGSSVEMNAAECKYCGNAIVADDPLYQLQHDTEISNPEGIQDSGKSKITAGLLGIFLGGIGAHKFYLGQTKIGLIYLIFFWTLIPEIIGIIEGIIYLSSSNEEFYYKHVRRYRVS